MVGLLPLVILIGLPSIAAAQTPLAMLQGMWSNPPRTIAGVFCAF